MREEEGGDQGGSPHTETAERKLRSEYFGESGVENPSQTNQPGIARRYLVRIFSIFWQTGFVLPCIEYAWQS